MVKSCFTDKKFNEEMSLGAVNSINWARILAQIVYYVHCALRVGSKEQNKKISFVVPTGNFGNVLAGYYAKRMGVPIARLVIASNTNDILPRFFQCGEYRITGAVVPTISPSMDIAVSSNFERFAFDLFGRDGAKTREKFNQLRSDSFFTVTEEQLETARTHFSSFAVNETDTIGTIARCFSQHNYLLCPHSAVGFAAGLLYLASLQSDSEAVVTLATAHIGKFTENILHSISSENRECPELAQAVERAIPEKLRQLSTAPTRRIEIANSVEAVKEYLRTNLSR
jgi:threonine synthase